MQAKPRTLKALAALIGYSHHDEQIIQGYCIDSRKVQPGDLFFALPGKKVDGHHFLKEAAQRGAAAAIVKCDYDGPAYGMALLHLPEVLEGLQLLAQKMAALMGYKIIAITGSLGKTTTKEFAKTLLSQKYSLHAAPLSYNSQATVPLTILSAKGDEELLLLEMGMSEPGQIQKLLSIAPPDLAVVTNISMQHVTHFPEGLEAISKEKLSIFSHTKTLFGLYASDIAFDQHLKDTPHCLKKNFSISDPDADFYLNYSDTGIEVQERNSPQPLPIPLKLPLKAAYHNFLAAYGVARLMHLSHEEICQKVSELQLPTMRFERVEKKGRLFINDAYNANPTAMVAALEALPLQSTGSRRIAVLSEMNDLGLFSEEGHMEVARSVLGKVDLLYCIGSRCSPMVDYVQKKGYHAELFDSKESILNKLWEKSRPSDVILLKGARAYALEELLHWF